MFAMCRRYVPLGLRAWFVGCGISNVVELDWWQEAQHVAGERNITVALTPAQVGPLVTVFSKFLFSFDS